MGFLTAKHSGLATGVPGAVSMLSLAHQDHGSLPWDSLFSDARQLATDGFPIGARLHNFLGRYSRFIPKGGDEGPADAYQYFYAADGTPHPVGHRLQNQAYAETLDMLAKDPTQFYQGPIADQIIAEVSKPPHAGGLKKSDLEQYQAQRRSALCTDYRELKLCGPPPPSSWLAVAATLGILEHAPSFSERGAEDPSNWSLFAEAQRLAYADRDHYVADPDHAPVPVLGMLDREYLKSRAELIPGNKAIPKASPGDPWAYQQEQRQVAGIDATVDAAGTSHFVVVDHSGNVVSMTASVESIFGSTRMAGGMFLNNQLTDFSFADKDADGNLIANRVGPGKRPRSSMSPTIVLDADGRFLMATGSPGGNSIIAYTLKSLVGVLEWGLSPQQAIDLPNLVARGDKVRIEQERADATLIQGLRDYGFEVKESAGENSGLSVVVRHPDGRLEGGVDPRREGVVEIIPARGG